MRFPRPWSKKRGGRLLGRRITAAAAELSFFAALLLVGVFGIALLVADQVIRIQGVTDAVLPSGMGVDNVLPDRVIPDHVIPDVGGSQLGVAFWVWLTISIVLTIIGATSLLLRLIRFGSSNERRAMMLRQSSPRELIAAATGEDVELPAVPTGQSVLDSPGMKLQYRLGGETADQNGRWAAAVLMLLAGGLCVVMLGVAIAALRQYQPRYVLMLLLLPIGYVAFWAFRNFLRRVRESEGVGSTIVEISDQPLQPGGDYRLYLLQFGKLRLRKLRVTLICEESTTFRQGTDVRTENKGVFQKELLCLSNLVIDPSDGFEQEFSVKLPENVMHSFRSDHNAVQWKVVVEGKSRKWPSFCRHFPVVVHPPGGPPKRSPR